MEWKILKEKRVPRFLPLPVSRVLLIENCNVPVLICVNLQICPFCTNQYINIFIILFLFFLFIIIQVI